MRLNFTAVKNYFGGLDASRVLVKAVMSVLSRKRHEHLRTIVRLSSAMMDGLMWTKMASDHFLDNKTMLIDAVIDRGGMLGAINEDISFAVGANAATPVRGGLAFLHVDFSSAIHRAGFLFSKISLKIRTAYKACLFRLRAPRVMACFRAILSLPLIELSLSYKKALFTGRALFEASGRRWAKRWVAFKETSEFVSHGVILT